MADVTDVRKAVLAKLLADTTLTALLGTGTRIFHVSARRGETHPALVYQDTGTRPDETVPMHERTFRFSAFHSTADAADQVLDRVRFLLHDKPLTITGPGWRFMGCRALADEGEPIEDGDVLSRSATLRMILYEVA